MCPHWEAKPLDTSNWCLAAHPLAQECCCSTIQRWPTTALRYHARNPWLSCCTLWLVLLPDYYCILHSPRLRRMRLAQPFGRKGLSLTPYFVSPSLAHRLSSLLDFHYSGSASIFFSFRYWFMDNHLLSLHGTARNNPLIHTIVHTDHPTIRGPSVITSMARAP